MIFPLYGRQFNLAKIGLMRAACPEAVRFQALNKSACAAIVILKNEKGYGHVDAAKYCPAAYVAGGERRRQWLFENGVAKSWAFVECGALQINADDAIGCKELMEKLDGLLTQKLVPVPIANSSPGNWPYIIEVYPFENYFIYTHQSKKYRQAFNLDPINRFVSLRGTPVAVQEQYVDVSASSYKIKSELVTQLICRWKNVVSAVERYRSESTEQKTVSGVEESQLPKLSRTLVAAGVNPFGFALWSSEAYGTAKRRSVATPQGVGVPHTTGRVPGKALAAR